jgi:hypothetical protein
VRFERERGDNALNGALATDCFECWAVYGWFAVIDDGKTKNSLSGVGHWKPGYGGPYGGKPFSISFTLTSGQLYMHMAVPADNGAAHLIKAIFEKLPVEDPAPSNDKIKA